MSQKQERKEKRDEQKGQKLQDDRLAGAGKAGRHKLPTAGDPETTRHKATVVRMKEQTGRESRQFQSKAGNTVGIILD